MSLLQDIHADFLQNVMYCKDEAQEEDDDADEDDEACTRRSLSRHVCVGLF